MINDNLKKSVIWDLPTRVFHWMFVLGYIITWLTFDDNRFLFVHVYAGYLFLSLLVFRFVWGFIGSHFARFRSFAYDWKSVTAYLKGLLNGDAMRHVGHNPVGGWAIFLILLLAILVSVTGLVTFGGEEGHGPLRDIVNYEIGIYARPLHEYLAWTMLLITVVHVLGVIVESFIHRENLVWAMITGHKEVDAGVPGVKGHHLLGVTMIVLVSVSALYYFRGYLTETADDLYQPFRGPDLADSETWRENCGECHFAFHPSLLPQRSWQKIFETQHEHFGDDLDLDEETYQELLTFHLDNAAESLMTEPSRKILFNTPKDETPVRITETHYWINKHEEIDPVYWESEKIASKSNCSACHLDADRGTYEDSDMRLPDLD